MPRLICQFSGWFTIDTDDVRLFNCETEELKTASEVLAAQGNIDNCVLDDFDTAHGAAMDGEFTALDLSIEDDSGENPVGPAEKWTEAYARMDDPEGVMDHDHSMDG